MLRRINRYRLAGRTCCVVKYKADNRYDDTKVATHDLQLHDAISGFKISEVWNDLLSAQVIGIDEGQFFEDLVDCCEKLANLGKIVIVAALDGDFNRKRFENNSVDLCALAECVTKLSAVCNKCGEDAAFTFRLTSNLKQTSLGEIQIGTTEHVYGRIELILGPMFAGKTTELWRRGTRHALAGRKCLVVNYDDDRQKCAEKPFTYNSHLLETTSATRLEDVYHQFAECEVALIDDAQFVCFFALHFVSLSFLDVVDITDRLANSGKIVIVSALDGDYHRKPFTNSILDLCPLSEAITKLCAVCCYCDSDAAFSRKLTNSSTGDAASEKVKAYQAVCRTCYMRNTKPLSVIQDYEAVENAIERESSWVGQGSHGGTVLVGFRRKNRSELAVVVKFVPIKLVDSSRPSQSFLW
ncbi:unnamed protein product [Enterobius vermicularis]|uniref:Thymidine kinase, cytosolic n=1 Tax=Enterobius vermicularis TaxID=51028 RepID=A0A0N4V6L7_ENTVE|nr:unnamed protein product [Enterobius vermicularis]